MAAAGSLVGGANTGFQQGIGILQKQAQIELERRRTAVAERPASRAITAGEAPVTPEQKQLVADVLSKQLGRPVSVDAVANTVSEATRQMTAGTAAGSATTRREQGQQRLNLKVASLKQSQRQFTENIKIARAQLRQTAARTRLISRGLDVRIFETELGTLEELNTFLDKPEQFPGAIRVLWSQTFGQPLPPGTITRKQAKELQNQLKKRAAEMAATIEAEGVPPEKGGTAAPTAPVEGGDTGEQSDEDLLKSFE